MKAKIKEREKIDKYVDLARELKKICGTWVTVIPIVVGVIGTVGKGLEKRLEELQKMNRNHPDYSFAEIG